MLLPLLVAAALAPGAAHAADIPNVEYQLQLDRYDIQTVDYRFPSGLRILFQADHTQPIVSITNWIDRGSVVDGVNEDGESVEGIAHTVEHLAFRAKHGDLPKNWDVINQLGGILNASTSSEWTNYMTVAPVDAAVPLLRIEALRLADGIRGVTPEDVEAEKSIVRNELRMGYESGANGSAAVRTALVHLPKLMYPEGHIYRNTTIGTHETIGNITYEAVKRYVDENYRPEFSTIAVVGDFQLEGGAPFKMIFDAFADVEHLLMSPEDAEAYKALETSEEKDAFIQDWFPKLEDHLKKTATELAEPRVDCDNPVLPPEPPVPYESQKKDEILKIKGMVDHPTAIAAWTLPSGYCPDDANMNIAAILLGSYIRQTVDADYDPFAQESTVEGASCGAFTDKRGSVMFCMVEQGAISKDKPERLLDKIADALYLQWQPLDPNIKLVVDQEFTRARMQNMSQTLNMTDNIASLYGRSFFVASHAHYTGRPTFFSDSIQGANLISYEDAKALAEKWITRDRMVGLIIEPMDEEERERLEASASEADKETNVADQHRAKDDKSRQLFDAKALTPEVIKSVAVVPERERMRELTLDNGLRVTIMNHGEAPLVKVGLQVRGSDANSGLPGLNGLAYNLHETGGKSWDNLKEWPLAVAGNVWKDDSMIYASGSSANLEALLHKARWQLEDYDWQMAKKAQTVKKRISTAKGDGKKPETWASRMASERLWPNHPYGDWLDPKDYEALGEAASLEVIQDWVYTKWQPQNAQLVVVGKIADMDAAEAEVRRFFETWEYRGKGTPGELQPPPPPQQQPDRQVLVFDKPTATQSKVSLTCQLKQEDALDSAAMSVLGEALSFLAFERLREEKGITYGAYGFPRNYWGNNAELVVGSTIQNDGVGFGVKTMFDLVQEAADGEFTEDFISTNKWNVARTLVSQQQSGDQMLTTLLTQGRAADPDYWDKYPDALANVDGKQIQRLLSTCKGHEVVTIVGPSERVTPLLDQEGIPFEVVDWEALYESQLDAKELKKYRKAKEEEAAEAAKEADET